jgi:hypothetical protein
MTRKLSGRFFENELTNGVHAEKSAPLKLSLWKRRLMTVCSYELLGTPDELRQRLVGWAALALALERWLVL